MRTYKTISYDCTRVLVGEANSFLLKNSINTPKLNVVPKSNGNKDE